MKEELRPDPDSLLKAIQKQESAVKRGKLRIFFGMSAGVGKTYAMLKAAQELKNEGRDLVVGTVDTHGRQETMALLEGLPVIPKKKIEYRGAALEEMDLDAILQRKPPVVLVDELAHTNVTGSRHPKRYQDVLELLEAGIDVFTTLNVQHIESQVDLVKKITGISIRETVPDSVFQLAEEIQLIDISPAELLERLSEGKVYLGDQAESAVKNFFKEETLTALREIALRLTAEKVGYELKDFVATRSVSGPLPTANRLLVAVSPNPASEELIRAARRLAFNLEAPWIALSIDTGKVLSPEEQNRLVKHLNLARELGAEVISTGDTDVISAIRRITHEHSITQIIIAKPVERRWRSLLGGGLSIERLLKSCPGTDIHIVDVESSSYKTDWPLNWLLLRLEPGPYIKTLLILAAVTLANWFLVPYIGYQVVGFVFLLMNLILGTLVGIGPILMSAILSALVWDFVFIPPHWTFIVSAPEDYMMLLAFLLVVILSGVFTLRLRRKEEIIRQREGRTQTLYHLSQALAESRGIEAMSAAVSQMIAQLFQAQAGIILSAQDKGLEKKVYPIEFYVDEKEWGVALWSFENCKTAGWSTDTLPMARSLCLPLKVTDRTIGVLLVRPHEDRKLSPDQQELLYAAGHQIAVSLEGELFEQQAKEASVLKESERLHQTLLNSISHELRTPLTTILGSATALQDEKVLSDKKVRRALAQELTDSADRLNHVIENLLDMSRISAGTLTLSREWFDVNEWVQAGLGRLKRFLSKHKVVYQPTPEAILLEGDFRLLEHALSNLLLNAAYYSPPGKAIELIVSEQRGQVSVTVADQGPGIPPEFLNRVFDKFYRIPGSPAGGVGLGLSIVKSIVEAHQGSVYVANRPSGGAAFTIILPVNKPPGSLLKTK